MTKITESAIEKFAVELLEKQGYQYIYAPVIVLIAKNAEGKLL
jgi:seryl-tRNA synthetase